MKRKYYITMQNCKVLMEDRRGFDECREGNGPYESGVGENRLASASSRQESRCKTRKKEPHVQKDRRTTGNGSGVVSSCSQYHKQSGFNNIDLFSHCSGVQKSEIWLWAGSVPLPKDVKTIFSVPLILVSGSLLAVFGVPWIVDTAPHSFPSSSYGVLLMFKFPLFIMATVTRMTHLN